MSVMTLAGLFIVGIGVGFINIVSAGGSLISLPALIFFGLPSSVANGTNRISVFIQNLFAIVEFSRKGVIHWKLSLIVSIPAVIGSIWGASVAITISDQVFNNSLAVIMVTVMVLILFKPQNRIKARKNVTVINVIASIGAFFLIGFYGGFIQAGVGFLIIASLTIFARKLSLVEMQGIKAVVINIYLFISTAIFIYNGQVDWGYALTLALGSSIGGWTGSKFAIRVSETFLKTAMLIVICLLAIVLLIRY